MLCFFFTKLIGLKYGLQWLDRESVACLCVCLPAPGYFQDNIACHFGASMISGFVTTCASMPVDIAKTRYTLQYCFQCFSIDIPCMYLVWFSQVYVHAVLFQEKCHAWLHTVACGHYCSASWCWLNWIDNKLTCKYCRLLASGSEAGRPDPRIKSVGSAAHWTKCFFDGYMYMLTWLKRGWTLLTWLHVLKNDTAALVIIIFCWQLLVGSCL